VYRAGQFDDVHRLAILRAEWAERRTTVAEEALSGASGLPG
jgi:hypothetical protein